MNAELDEIARSLFEVLCPPFDETPITLLEALGYDADREEDRRC